MLRKAISKLPSLASTSVTPSCPARSCKATRQRGGRHVPDPRLSAPRGRMGLPAGRRGATFPFPLRGRSAVTSCRRRRRRGEAAAGAERGGARGRRGLGGPGPRGAGLRGAAEPRRRDAEEPGPAAGAGRLLRLVPAGRLLLPEQPQPRWVPNLDVARKCAVRFKALRCPGVGAVPGLGRSRCAPQAPLSQPPAVLDRSSSARAPGGIFHAGK